MNDFLSWNATSPRGFSKCANLSMLDSFVFNEMLIPLEVSPIKCSPNPMCPCLYPCTAEPLYKEVEQQESYTVPYYGKKYEVINYFVCNGVTRLAKCVTKSILWSCEHCFYFINYSRISVFGHTRQLE